MKKKNVELLKGSIEKWLEIKRSTKVFERGAYDCSLCQEYQNSGCSGCLIKERTGQNNCFGTPFHVWREHQEGIHTHHTNRHRVSYCKECTNLANDMLGFLISLLPVKEIKKIL